MLQKYANEWVIFYRLDSQDTSHPFVWNNLRENLNCNNFFTNFKGVTSEDLNVYNFEKWLFSIVFFLKCDLRFSTGVNHILFFWIDHFLYLEEWQNHLQYWLDKAFKGTVVNRVLPSLHGGSTEIIINIWIW